MVTDGILCENDMKCVNGLATTDWCGANCRVLKMWVQNWEVHFFCLLIECFSCFLFKGVISFFFIFWIVLYFYVLSYFTCALFAFYLFFLNMLVFYDFIFAFFFLHISSSQCAFCICFVFSIFVCFVFLCAFLSDF